MAPVRCIKCDTILKFNFGPCDYTCPKCGAYYTEHEINQYYGED